MIQKSYYDCGHGKLYLVPTPIGNMGDITTRAIDVLREAPYIYAEDTREAQALLKKFSIFKIVRSCHKFSEERNKSEIIGLLRNGYDVAYMSDRGTPLISDPGQIIVREAIKYDFNVVALPGPSALLPALNMSGIDNSKFLFYGFLNSKSVKRIEELKRIRSIEYTIVFYEAPHRITKTLSDIKMIFGNRNVAICREISKKFEEVFRGDLVSAIEYSKDIKGEMVIVVEGYDGKTPFKVDYVFEVMKLVNAGEMLSTAIKIVSMTYGISKNELYNSYLKYSKKQGGKNGKN